MASAGIQQEQLFNAQAAVKAFVADPSRSALELPPLSVGQRKNVKKVVEQYPDLKCESYGFGQERQMHIFKKQSVNRPPSSVAAEVHLGPPPGLPPSPSGSRSRSKPMGAAAEELPFNSPPPGLEELCAGLTEKSAKPRSNSPDRSTVAPSPTTGSPASSYREVMATPPGLRPPPGLDVRSPMPFVEGGVYEERTIQSMPHGMFRRALRQEAMERTPSLPPAPRREENTLTPGTEVMIVGLQKLPAFNGRSGCINDFDQETGRYTILLMPDGQDPTSNSSKWAKVKRENLVPAMPTPPAREALSYPGCCSSEWSSWSSASLPYDNAMEEHSAVRLLGWK